jgi:hypothetical protein
MKKIKIFLSHSTEEDAVIKNICGVLENDGAVCWFAPRDIGYGQEWAAEITRGLRDDTGLFVLVLSSSANESKHVLREVNLADQYNIKTLGFQVGEVKLSDALNYYLSIEQMYVCQSDSAKEVEEEILSILRQKDWQKKAQTTKHKRVVPTALVPTLDYVSRGLEDSVRETLERGEIAVLYGEGGMGKSCLAVQYYLANKGNYSDIQFVNAETPQEALKSLGISEYREVTSLESCLTSAFE